MFNNTGVEKVELFITTQILFAVEHQVSVGCVVEATGIDINGKKILKAGTPLSGSYEEGQFAVLTEVTEENIDKIAGVLLHDVLLNEGKANGTLLIHGFVNTNRLDTVVKPKITSAVRSGLPLIKFVAR